MKIRLGLSGQRQWR